MICERIDDMFPKSKGLSYLRRCVVPLQPLLGAAQSGEWLRSICPERCAACYVAREGGETRLRRVQAAHEAGEAVTSRLPIKQPRVVAAMATVLFEDDLL